MSEYFKGFLNYCLLNDSFKIFSYLLIYDKSDKINRSVWLSYTILIPLLAFLLTLSLQLNRKKKTIGDIYYVNNMAVYVILISP